MRYERKRIGSGFLTFFNRRIRSLHPENLLRIGRIGRSWVGQQGLDPLPLPLPPAQLGSARAPRLTIPGSSASASSRSMASTSSRI